MVACWEFGGGFWVVGGGEMEMEMEFGWEMDRWMGWWWFVRKVYRGMGGR